MSLLTHLLRAPEQPGWDVAAVRQVELAVVAGEALLHQLGAVAQLAEREAFVRLTGREKGRKMTEYYVNENKYKGRFAICICSDPNILEDYKNNAFSKKLPYSIRS